MKSGSIERTIYMYPPEGLHEDRGIIWELLKMPYGISETDRYWADAIERRLIHKMGFETVQAVSQLFVSTRGNVQLYS